MLGLIVDEPPELERKPSVTNNTEETDGKMNMKRTNDTVMSLSHALEDFDLRGPMRAERCWESNKLPFRAELLLFGNNYNVSGILRNRWNSTYQPWKESG